MEERTEEIFQNDPQKDKEIKHIRDKLKGEDEHKDPTYVS